MAPPAPRIDPNPTIPFPSQPNAFSPPPATRGPTSLLGEIVGGITGFATGGIGGAIQGWQNASGGTSVTAPKPPTIFAGGGATGQSGFNMPFGVTGPGGVPLPGFSAPAQGGACPKGYHLNKHPLAASKRHGAVPAGSMCVRNRHMHALNSKAITRSLRRIKRASKIVRKLHAFSGTRRIASSSRGGHRAGCGCVVCRRK